MNPPHVCGGCALPFRWGWAVDRVALTPPFARSPDRFHVAPSSRFAGSGFGVPLVSQARTIPTIEPVGSCALRASVWRARLWQHQGRP